MKILFNNYHKKNKFILYMDIRLIHIPYINKLKGLGLNIIKKLEKFFKDYYEAVSGKPIISVCISFERSGGFTDIENKMIIKFTSVKYGLYPSSKNIASMEFSLKRNLLLYKLDY